MVENIRDGGYFPNHNIPRIFVPFVSDFNSTQGVETVGAGKWGRVGKGKRLESKIQYYDGTTRTFKVSLRGQGYVMDVFLRIEDGYRALIQNKINNFY